MLQNLGNYMTKNQKLIKSELLKSNLSRFFNEFPEVDFVTVNLSTEPGKKTNKQNSEVFLLSAIINFDPQTIKETHPVELHENSLSAQVSLHNYIESSINIGDLYKIMGEKIKLTPNDYTDKINEFMADKKVLVMQKK